MMLSVPAVTMATNEAVNINTADVHELTTTLTNMDKKTAQAIVDYREKMNLSQLKKVC